MYDKDLKLMEENPELYDAFCKKSIYWDFEIY